MVNPRPDPTPPSGWPQIVIRLHPRPPQMKEGKDMADAVVLFGEHVHQATKVFAGNGLTAAEMFRRVLGATLAVHLGIYWTWKDGDTYELEQFIHRSVAEPLLRVAAPVNQESCKCQLGVPPRPEEPEDRWADVHYTFQRGSFHFTESMWDRQPAIVVPIPGNRLAELHDALADHRRPHGWILRADTYEEVLLLLPEYLRRHLFPAAKSSGEPYENLRYRIQPSETTRLLGLWQNPLSGRHQFEYIDAYVTRKHSGPAIEVPAAHTYLPLLGHDAASLFEALEETENGKRSLMTLGAGDSKYILGPAEAKRLIDLAEQHGYRLVHPFRGLPPGPV